jgi:hypothetical protein
MSFFRGSEKKQNTKEILSYHVSSFFQKHADHVFASFGCSDKSLVEVEGSHNDFRGVEFWRAVCSFVSRVAGCRSGPSWDVDVAQVLPIRDGEPDFSALLCPGPLRFVIHNQALQFFAPSPENAPPIWSFPFSSFVSMEAGISS